MTNNPQQGRGWAHVTYFCRIRKISPWHAIKWGQQCCRRWTSVDCTYEGRRQWCYTL